MSLIIPPSFAAPPPTGRAAVALCIDALWPTGHVGLTARLRAHASAAVQSTGVCTAIRPLTGLPARLVRDQLDRVFEAGVDAIGLGDPGDAPLELAGALTDRLDDGPPLIIAPGAVDRHREPRFDPASLRALADRLFRRAEAVVLDTDEVELLTGRRAPDLRRMKDAARRIADTGVRWVIVTGGRIEGHAVDLAYDGDAFTEFGADRIDVDHQAGAGAAFAGLITAHRARGLSILEALDKAKRGIGDALSRPIDVGGAGRIDPLRRAFERIGLDPTPIAIDPPDPD